MAFFKSANAAPKVLVSLKPLYGLTAQLMAGIATPELLLQSFEDPHHFTLTPSQAKKIKEANLLIWVGPSLETFLPKMIKAFQKDHLALLETPGLTLLFKRSKENPTSFDNVPSNFFLISSNKEKEQEKIDPHIWLNVENTRLMVEFIKKRLQQIDPQHASLYEENGRLVETQLADLKKELEAQEHSLKNLNFIAFHDAYAYLEHQYGMRNRGADLLAGSHHHHLGLHSYQALRSLLNSKQVSCIMTEPQQSKGLPEKLASEFKAPLYSLDPLGLEITLDGNHYVQLMRTLFSQLQKCQTPPHDLSS